MDVELRRKFNLPARWFRSWLFMVLDRERRIRQLEVITGMMSEARGADAAEYRDLVDSIRRLQDRRGAERAELVAALHDLAFNARTSGGVGGRDASLCEACDHAERLLVKYAAMTGNA
jgi:hypothetical protein